MSFRKKAAMRAMNHLFKNMPFEATIELPDGRKGIVKPFFEPRWFYAPETLRTGIDVKVFEDGDQSDDLEQCGHLEFTLTLSGWDGDCMDHPIRTEHLGN